MKKTHAVHSGKPHRPPRLRETSVERLRSLTVLQSPFLQLPGVRIHKRNLLKTPGGNPLIYNLGRIGALLSLAVSAIMFYGGIVCAILVFRFLPSQVAAFE